jgi:hypothetical protein
MPANAGIQVRFTVQVQKTPGFRRNDARVDFQSTNSEPIGLEPRLIRRIERANALDFDGVGKINGVGLRVTLR